MMRKSNYPERDYIFGQAMLTLRTQIGLTQAKLAETLGVSRKAIGNWERGSSYPQPEHLKSFIALAVQHGAFPAGGGHQEVRALWDSAHQKVLFDETWFATLTAHLGVSPAWPPFKGAAAPAALARRVDLDGAPADPAFYGREWEMDLLASWVVADRCRVISVLGLGGIGKSALVARLMHRVDDGFEAVIWRSLRNLATGEAFFTELIQVLSPESISGEATSPERYPVILLELMRKTQVLLVLDNLEALLEAGEDSGRLQPGFESLGRFLSLAAETEHQSSVIITSREVPAVLVPFEGSQMAVRSLRLASLDTASCDKLLSENALIGCEPDREQLIEAYSGNPLALKIVAHTILDLFDGEIGPFLDQGEVIFGGVRNLLDEQFYRLPSLEQSLLLWLTILHEPATIDQLEKVLLAPVTRARLLEALDALVRHSLIEHGLRPHEFTLQPLVREYLSAWLRTHITAKDQAEKLVELIEHGGETVPGREETRQAEERLDDLLQGLTFRGERG